MHERVSGGRGSVHVQLCHFSSSLIDLVDPAGYSRQTHTQAESDGPWGGPV